MSTLWIIAAYVGVVVLYVVLVMGRCLMSEQGNNPYFGRMNDPSAAARVTGPCGDSMEFYLIIRDDIIETVRYHTDGCQYTHLCGAAVAAMAEGASIKHALTIHPALLLDALEDLPPAHRHCAILSVSTLYRAIGEYWVQWVRS